MVKKIIREVAKAYADCNGLDEIKRGIKLAMEIAGLDGKYYDEIFMGVMYEMAVARKEKEQA